MFKTFKPSNTARPFQGCKPGGVLNFIESLHLAAARWIGKYLVRYSDHFILAADHFAQVNVLDRIVSLEHSPNTPQTVDFDLFHHHDHFFFLGDVALNGVDSYSEQQSYIITLYHINVKITL